uniref:Uncharacterized protein n=1 Tax=Pyramimonas obovata TaxID=1411642 RepID=A0A7S0MVQ1_9CHLO|mmetsp:Transcript_13529/g.28809  ORF Transcript_13529/g.28809 Transcript_13529/m.28809 type:complete len:197 (+) Transcript_13529:217-807(+)|eukprot:CAMPEP_0118932720 /NCGR_PEP_ID=MMETSP1169-20130426/10585_1 /TAXON_ID=36882 /ORGANISM="Pyramimonas obovata, Strain CCMP722" /LENGTH=196 /DNA_ID=CAMNT_0006875417 /DNA_START=217 /DNA_END=807 /DNA_ORIENTATION=+
MSLSWNLKTFKKQSGTRKHLDMIIADKVVEFGETLESMRLEREGITYTQQIEELVKKNREEETGPAVCEDQPTVAAVKDFDPPYLKGGVVARDIARSVADRRAPNGTFFQNTNPALFREKMPSTNPIKPRTPLHSSGSEREGGDPEEKKKVGFEPIPHPKESWLTAAQKNDRSGGMAQSKMVSSRRTPSGGFFQKV